MREYTLKPALLAGPRTYRIKDGVLTCRTSDGTLDWQVALADVDHAAFVEHRLRGQNMMRFDLTASGIRRSVSLNSGSGAGSSPDVAAFLDLIDALCVALVRERPGLHADFGEYGRYRLIWFAIGVLSVLSGGGILGAAVLTGVSVDRLVSAGIGLGVLILFGLVLMRTYNPWASLPAVPVETLGVVLRARIGGGA